MRGGKGDHRDFPLDDIDFRKYERKYERLIGRQWVSLNRLNCKMFTGKTNILYFFLSRCKKNGPTVHDYKQFGNIKLQPSYIAMYLISG